jgi:regulation of enolase protein 1 (concanavalin A-like superfamily)
MQRGRNVFLVVLTSTLAVVGWVGRPATAAVPGVQTTGLPAGWEAAPLGSDDTVRSDAKQSVTYDNGKLTIQAGGKGLDTDADGGLIVDQKHSGNGSITFHLVSQTGGQTGGLVETAVAFRESQAPGSRAVWLSYTSGNKLMPQTRVADDGASQAFGVPNSLSIGFVGNGDENTPAAGRDIGDGIWLGMERNGDDFNVFFSNDGKVWSRVGGATFSLPADLLVGIEASAHDDDDAVAGEVQTSVIDNITVSNELLSPRSVQNVTYLPSDKSVLVTWTPIAVADGDVTYNVYQINANATDKKLLTPQPIKESSFRVENLTDGQPYRFAVTAVANGAESPLHFPEPNGTNQNGRRLIGVAVPNPPVLLGLQMYYVGTADLATTAVTGDAANPTLDFKAGGANIWQEGDGVAFLAMPIEGDVDMSVNFVSGPTEANGDGWEHGGVLIRESLDPGSRLAYSQAAQGKLMEFKRRRARYAQPTNTDVSRDDDTARPLGMRLTRTGDTFQSYYSEDGGNTWKDLGDPNDTTLSATSKDTLPGFAKTAYVGITLCAHFTGEEGSITDAVINNIKIIKK